MSYSNGLLSDQSYQTANKYGQRGLPGVGFKLTGTGDYDMQNKKLTNVKSGTDSNDAVNKSQLDSLTISLQGSRAGYVVNDKAVIYSNTGAVHARSLYLLDDPQDGNSNEVRLETPHQSYDNIHLNIPDLHNFDGYGGRPKSEVMVTSVKQTITGENTFENIITHNPVNNNQAANKGYVDNLASTKLSLTGGVMTGDLILPYYNYPFSSQSNPNRAISYRLQKRLFVPRNSSLPMNANLNMNNFTIKNLKDPLTSYDCTNKKYVDEQIANIPVTETRSFLKIDGTRAMTGNLNMDSKKIMALKTPTLSTDACTKGYTDPKISSIPKIDTSTFFKKTGDTMTGDLILPHHNNPIPGNTNKVINYESQREIFLSRQESFPMQADINMNNNFIQNIATPTSSHQATNKGYCDYNFLNRQKGGVLMGPLSMNRNDLIEIPDTPKFGHSAVNKKYVDGEITKTDTTPFVKLDGSRPMTGNLDMGDHPIQKVGDPVNSDDVATKNYVDAEIGYISTPFLKLDGTRAMTGVLNMNDHKISNLKMPEFNTDAANKQYIDEAFFFKSDGTRAMTGNLDMDNNKIRKIGAPINAYDATNRYYVDTEIAYFSADTKRYVDEKIIAITSFIGYSR